MVMFEFALVVLFWATVVLALTSLLTPNAAFLCKTRTRLRGAASWLCLAIVFGTLNVSFSSVNTLF